MNRIDREHIRRNPQWRTVLESYAVRQRQLKEQSPDGDRWVERLPSVAGIDDAQLAPIHGRLIAFGYLRFRLADRQAGVLYQLSPLGRQLLEVHSDDTAA